MYHTVNTHFSEKKHRPYLGSRDIDLGIYLKPMMSKSQLISTPLFSLIEILESEGFTAEGIRYKKEMTYSYKHPDDEKLKEASYPLYIDIIVNAYPPSYTDIIEQYFFEEPLVESIYTNPKNQIDMPDISTRIFIPIPEILIACKIKSISGRETHHKQVKDICDLYSLLFYSSKTIDQIINEIMNYVSPTNLSQLKHNITNEMIQESEQQLGEPPGSIATVLNHLFTTYGI